MADAIINYWAVLGATAAAMIIGSIWYSPFGVGKYWMKEMGWHDGKMPGGSQAMANKSMALMAVAALIMAYVLAHFVSYLNLTTWMQGAQLGFWIWLGFIATTTIATVLFEGRKWSLYWIYLGNMLLTLLAMGIILAVWR